MVMIVWLIPPTNGGGRPLLLLVVLRHYTFEAVALGILPFAPHFRALSAFRRPRAAHFFPFRLLRFPFPFLSLLLARVRFRQLLFGRARLA